MSPPTSIAAHDCARANLCPAGASAHADRQQNLPAPPRHCPGPFPQTALGRTRSETSAVQASLFLAAQSPRVYLVGRGDDLSADMSRHLVDRIEANPRIEVLLHTEVCEVKGDKAVESAVAKDRHTGEGAFGVAP